MGADMEMEMAAARPRTARVQYWGRFPGWGRSPVRVLVESLLRALVFGAMAWGAIQVAGLDLDDSTLSEEQQRWLPVAARVIAAFFGVVVVYNLARALIGVVDIAPRRTIEGPVVVREERRTGDRLPKLLQLALYSGRDEQSHQRNLRRRRRSHLAVDDGSSERVIAYVVRPAVYRSASLGDRVRIQVSPRLGYVSKIEVLEPASR